MAKYYFTFLFCIGGLCGGSMVFNLPYRIMPTSFPNGFLSCFEHHISIARPVDFPVPLNKNGLVKNLPFDPVHQPRCFVSDNWVNQGFPVIGSNGVLWGRGDKMEKRIFPPDFNGPAPFRKGDLLITEIMFNPSEFCLEYLEITNFSSDTLRMETHLILSVGTKEIKIPISGAWPPGDSRVFVSDIGSVDFCYPEVDPDLVFVIPLPALSNEGNELTLYTNSGDGLLFMDQVSYSPADHNDFFKNSKGVSLERDISRSLSNKWRSGFVQFQYRSPGFVPKWDSSMTVEIQFSETVIYAEPQMGPSILEMKIVTDGSDGSITIEVFDINGDKVQSLANGLPVQGGDVVTWDGRVSGKLLPEGLYLFWIYFFDTEGRKRIFKRTCILSNKYD